jgi:pilus assembly protein CpaC
MAPRPPKCTDPGEPRRSRVLAALWLGCALAAGAALPGAARAADSAASPQLALDVDQAQMIDLGEPASTVFVANPEIADVQVPGAPNSAKFLVFGRKAGKTTIFAVTRSNRVVSYAVSVRRQVGEIASALKREIPGARVEVASAPNGIIVTGSVETPRDAQRLKKAAAQFLGEKDSLNFNVAVEAATQVNLRIRVAEVSRSADKEFGFNWGSLFNSGTFAIGLLTGRAPLNAVTGASGAPTSTFGDFSRSGQPDNFDSIGLGYKSAQVNASALIDALQAEGLVTVLAEPNLTAVSGETATFLAGGEFPVPIAQALQQITIEWKKFGVSVEFTPTVLAPDRISVKVRPEVSELSSTGAVVINNVSIPALNVRRAETTVELASGQSFAIAGLFQNNVSNQLQQLPFLGDVPVLGTLFRSSRFQRNESELVIIVTPYIVKPVDRAADLHVPTENLVFSNDLERILLGRLTAVHTASGAPLPPEAAMPHLTGSAGFMLEP